MEIINYKYLQSINIIFKYIIIFDIKDIIHNEVGGKSPPTLIPTDCSVLRTPTILPNIRISWDYHPTFMLILGRVPRSFTHL